ncbi:MAG: hypothetical protein R2747_10355 [Pyrinomonadaceae bacterium]
MKRKKFYLFLFLIFFFLFFGLIASQMISERARERSAVFFQKPRADYFGEVDPSPDSDSEPPLEGDVRSGIKSIEKSPQAAPNPPKTFASSQSPLLPKIIDPVREMLSAARAPDDDEEREARGDQPDEAAKFRRLQMLDEKGEIPIDGLLKARRQMDRMAAFQRAKAAAAGEKEGLEVAGLAPGDWTWLGPGNAGGRVRSIVIDPNNGNNMWVGGVGGGIWRTSNAGTSWQPVNDFMANLAVSTMVINPNNSTILYAGTGEGFGSTDVLQGGGIFQSTDSGATWNLLASTNPAAPNLPGCGVGSAPCSAFWSYVNRVAVSPDGGTILAATGGNDTSVTPAIRVPGGIARSIDGGATWTQQTSVTAQEIDFDPTNSNNAVAGELTVCPSPPGPPCAASVRYSTDGGQTWTSATFNPGITNGGAGATNGRAELAYAPSNSNIVYAAVNNNNGDIYRSTDGGQNYTRVNTGTNFFLGSNNQGWYDNAIWVNPQDPTFLIVGGIDLWRSTNSGANFTQISRWQCGTGQTSSCANTSAHADQHMIVASPGFDNSTNKIVYFGNDGGMFRADDVSTVGQTNGWINLNNNLGITQFYGGTASVNGVLFGGTQDNSTLRADVVPNMDPPYDPQGWMVPSGGAGDGGYVAADPADPNYLYGETQNLGLFRSSDGGMTVTSINAGITETANANFIAPFIIDPGNPDTMLAGALSLWQSTDVKSAAVPTWTAIKPPNPIPQPAPNPPLPNPISAIAVSPTASSFIVVGHNNGAIFMTTTGGLAWNQINTPPAPPGTPPTPQRFVTRVAIDNTRTPNWIYATFGGFNNNNVWVTKDLGATWIDVSGASGTATDLPAVPVRSILINPANNNFLYVGTEVGIFASNDGGATWQLPNGGPANVSVDELFLYQGDLLAATHGRGVYTTRAPVLDLPVCSAPASSGGCPFPASFCPSSGSCCVVGNWECPCTWNNGQVPTVNDDVAVYCPITVNSAATARNLRVDGRLSLNGGSVNVQGDIVNFGLIESVGGFSSNVTGDDLLNVRPENAVTLRGIISLTFPATIRGNVANYGIITGAGTELNGPVGAIQQISGTGQWNNSFLRISRTAYLGSDVTLDSGMVIVQPFARLRLNDLTLTVNSPGFINSGTVDVGSGTLNFKGSQFQSNDPNNGDALFGFKGTGTVNLAPAAAANFSVAGGPGTFQPSLRAQSGTVDSVFRGFIDGSFIIDPGATFNFNEGNMTVNGDIIVNGTLSKNSAFTTSVLDFNGANFTNNGSVLVDFLTFNSSGTPGTKTVAGAGSWFGTSVGIGGNSTLVLANDATFNQSQFLVPVGNILNLGNFTLTYTGANMFVNGRVIGTGTFRMQPPGTASLTGTGTDPFATGVRIASGTVTPSTRVSGPFTIDPGATLSGGSLAFFGNIFTNNGAVASTSLSFDGLNFQPVNQQFGGTGTFAGPGGQMVISQRSTIALLSDVTYAGPRIFNEGRLNTGAFTLTLPCPTGTEGSGEIVGNVRRTNLAACSGPIPFGSPFTTIQFTSGTPPTEISVNVSLNPPPGFPNAVGRTYLITPVGGSGYTADLRLHYLDSELNGNDETILQLFRNDGTNWTLQGVTSRNTTDNWVEYSGVTQFSPWAIGQLAPTAAEVSVGGRVSSPGGWGVVNALVLLTDPAGQTRSVRTNPFGYYRFDEVPVGEIYILTVRHKQYVFTPQIVLVTEGIKDLDFIASP